MSNSTEQRVPPFTFIKGGIITTTKRVSVTDYTNAIRELTSITLNKRA